MQFLASAGLNPGYHCIKFLQGSLYARAIDGNDPHRASEAELEGQLRRENT